MNRNRCGQLQLVLQLDANFDSKTTAPQILSLSLIKDLTSITTDYIPSEWKDIQSYYWDCDATVKQIIMGGHRDTEFYNCQNFFTELTESDLKLARLIPNCFIEYDIHDFENHGSDNVNQNRIEQDVPYDAHAVQTYLLCDLELMWPIFMQLADRLKDCSQQLVHSYFRWIRIIQSIFKNGTFDGSSNTSVNFQLSNKFRILVACTHVFSNYEDNVPYDQDNEDSYSSDGEFEARIQTNIDFFCYGGWGLYRGY